MCVRGFDRQCSGSNAEKALLGPVVSCPVRKLTPDDQVPSLQIKHQGMGQRLPRLIDSTQQTVGLQSLRLKSARLFAIASGSPIRKRMTPTWRTPDKRKGALSASDGSQRQIRLNERCGYSGGQTTNNVKPIQRLVVCNLSSY